LNNIFLFSYFVGGWYWRGWWRDGSIGEERREEGWWLLVGIHVTYYVYE
jgi:hypothetical protein